LLVVLVGLGEAVFTDEDLALGWPGAGFVVKTGLAAAPTCGLVAPGAEDTLLLSDFAEVAVAEAGLDFGLICTGAAFTWLLPEVLPGTGWLTCPRAIPVLSTTAANWIKFIFISEPLATPNYFCATVVAAGAGAVAAGAPRTLL